MREKWKSLGALLLMLCFCYLLAPVKAEANSMATAQTIGVNESYSGVLTENEKVYFYKIDLPSSGCLEVLNVTSTMERFGITLYEGAASDSIYYDTLYENGGVPGMGSYKWELSKGTYYIRLIGNNGNWNDGRYTGSYSFRLNFTSAGVNHSEANNVINSAYPISIGSEIKGHFSMTDHVDFYKLTMPYDGKVNIKYLAAVERLGIRIYNENFQSVTGETAYWDSAAAMASGTHTFCLEKGVYYLRFLNNNWNWENGNSHENYRGNYSFTVSLENAGVNHSEPNNTLPQASAVTLGQTVTGFIAENNGVDYYKIQVPKATEVSITATIYLESLGLKFYNADYSEMDDNKGKFTYYWDSASKSGTGTEKLTLSQGTYYVRVVGGSSWSDDSSYFGKYSLKFSIPDNVSTITKTKITSVSSISTKTCTGKAIRPSVTVKAGSKKLTKNKDYTISYANNIRPGRAKAVIRGTGNYTGTKTVYFYIKPAKARMISARSTAKGKVTLKYRKMTGVSGYQIYYSTRKNGGYKRAKTTSRTTYTLRKTSKKVYYFKVRAYKKVGKTTLYGSFSTPKRVRIR